MRINETDTELVLKWLKRAENWEYDYDREGDEFKEIEDLNSRLTKQHEALTKLGELIK
jgi:hypothetical protein